jgi:hypothetical protein
MFEVPEAQREQRLVPTNMRTIRGVVGVLRVQALDADEVFGRVSGSVGGQVKISAKPPSARGGRRELAIRRLFQMSIVERGGQLGFAD